MSDERAPAGAARAVAPSELAGQRGGESLRARAEGALQQQREREARQRRDAPDPGTVLASVPRSDGTELRVSLHHYEGKPFVRVAPWQRDGASGAFWPVKGKGATVRVSELARVASALLDALDTAAPSNDRR